MKQTKKVNKSISSRAPSPQQKKKNRNTSSISFLLVPAHNITQFIYVYQHIIQHNIIYKVYRLERDVDMKCLQKGAAASEERKKYNKLKERKISLFAFYSTLLFSRIKLFHLFEKK